MKLYNSFVVVIPETRRTEAGVEEEALAPYVFPLFYFLSFLFLGSHFFLEQLKLVRHEGEINVMLKTIRCDSITQVGREGGVGQVIEIEIARISLSP